MTGLRTMASHRASPVDECFEYDLQIVKAENHTQNTPPRVMCDH